MGSGRFLETHAALKDMPKCAAPRGVSCPSGHSLLWWSALRTTHSTTIRPTEARSARPSVRTITTTSSERSPVLGNERHRLPHSPYAALSPPSVSPAAHRLARCLCRGRSPPLPRQAKHGAFERSHTLRGATRSSASKSQRSRPHRTPPRSARGRRPLERSEHP